MGQISLLFSKRGPAPLTDEIGGSLNKSEAIGLSSSPKASPPFSLISGRERSTCWMGHPASPSLNALRFRRPWNSASIGPRHVFANRPPPHPLRERDAPAH